MNRKQFIKSCGYTCLSLAGLPILLDSCTGTKYVEGRLADNKLSVAKTDFFTIKGETKKAKHYLIVKSESLNYPVVLYRISDSQYTALLLECTHQNMELNVNGDLISCSAHGSEFNNKGEVLQGPAEQHLKQFRVSHDPETIYIHLL